MRYRAQLIGAVAIIALSAAIPLRAAQAADAPHTITVSGEGEARGVPNQAQLSAGVTTVAATADAALAENARKMTAVFAALRRIGVPERQIQTSNFAVSPQYPPYNQNNTGLQRIVGYQVSNQVNVTLDDTGKLGPALDALVGAGANQINSVSFNIRDPSGLMTTAREAAVTDAMKRAQTYAHAAGVSLGAILSIQDGEIQAPHPIERRMFMAAAAPPPPPTPTAAGEESVTANVTIVFEIR